MPARLLLCLMLVPLFACPGPRKGPEANETYFWKVSSSDVAFGNCSDASDFRASITPIEFTDSSYFVYKVAADLKTATTQSCTALDTRTCKTPENPVVFDIVGNEFTFTQARSDLIDPSACKLQQTETWTLQDKGMVFTLDIDNVLSLTDSTVDCPKVEDSLKKRSPNMLGIVGCVVTHKLTGEFR